ncbi:hypothetical protein WN59_01510 [Salinicoccus sediminis]|uniref:Lipoprotein n=1 Tax=Salinicoccus sediminis TaxID=1432562 RepID=A0A0M2SPA5_9STAP|nr:hypothetical protein [Salinicoccus sediminis]KKK35536.1 hypothetical protein WN59_01510 [Salinicoccus sediminis]
MKRSIKILLPIVMLAGCGSPSAEEQLSSAEEKKEELQGVLQTEEVNVQKNKLRLDALEEDISKMQSVIGNSDIDEYVQVVGEYSGTLEKELTGLSEAVQKAKEEDDLSVISKDIDDISSSISEAADNYEKAAEGLELNEYLKRQHSSLKLANDEIEGALQSIKNGADSESMEAVDEGLAQLNSASEYY